MTPGVLAIKTKAREVGFDLCGIARAERHPKLARLAEWIASGYAGDMTYLARSCDERLDPSAVLPRVRSIISLAVVYNTDSAAAARRPGSGAASIARYARGEDYHAVLRDRLRQLVVWLSESAGDGLEAFSCVDDGPVQERVYAERAGLGWIGKNTCVINPQLGSWMFLAEVLTNLDLEADAPAVDQCGTCTRCLDACPTGAIVEPYTVDATRCLSYLTIETRQPVATTLRPSMGPQVYGCDICQEVCPWNRRAATSADPAWQSRPTLQAPTLIDLCVLSDDDWRALLRTSAMRRAGLRRIRRSLAYAAANLPAPECEVAADALTAHPSAADADVAEAIAWARGAAGKAPESAEC